MATADFLGRPAPPETKDCDWCDEKAVAAYELYRPRKKVGLAQYVYACGRHRQSATRAVDAKRHPEGNK